MEVVDLLLGFFMYEMSLFQDRYYLHLFFGKDNNSFTLETCPSNQPVSGIQYYSSLIITIYQP